MNCGDVPGNIALKHRPYISYWCLVGNGWEWGNGMIITSDYGSFPDSLPLAPVRYGVPPINRFLLDGQSWDNSAHRSERCFSGLFGASPWDADPRNGRSR